MRNYFVYYSYMPQYGSIQYANAHIGRENPVKDLDDIRVIEETIRENFRTIGAYITNITVINWRQFE